MPTVRRLVLFAILGLALAVVVALKRDRAAPPPAAAALPAAAAAGAAAPGAPRDVPSEPVTSRPPEAAAAPDAPAAPGAVPPVARARTAAPRGPVALPRLVDVGADQCIPCKAMAPILEELRQEYAGRLRVDFIDAWKFPDQATPFRVIGIPTQIFFDPSGRELFRHVGFFSKEDILATWRRLGYPLTARGESET
ncbi:MAG TPA: thioredoxin family protein [Vicinamibacterales bacterium]|nr:thioredoxin family protein [Vicinamibacterales bacterium]